ncbi:6-phospho-3-hexuloisomerase [Methanobacterium alcaliphilum]|uniref:6-phospho-3-hexuloisomerase n=1 Tax=Methanobacterium alcaliphilum TaxID=392018 RepID=UPI00200AA137|nr:6-phospho-3-hexuloisomerase [Methanobacterium alcaliphilum]MCK9151988.1 6-phospho-3-hexuloisomerase [Methanobacterium alcaliphilum]
MIINDAISEIIGNIEDLSQGLEEETINKMMDMIMASDNVFVLGLGRSGLVAKAFAMRLMHLGVGVYVVGETITPAIYENDCLLAISGSGETSSVISTAKITEKRGAKIIAVTSYTDSSLAEMADLVVEVKGRTKIDSEQDYDIRQMNGKHQSLAPLGTLFEVTSLIFLDGFIAQLMAKMKKTEDDMKLKHNVLE